MYELDWQMPDNWYRLADDLPGDPRAVAGLRASAEATTDRAWLVQYSTSARPRLTGAGWLRAERGPGLDRLTERFAREDSALPAGVLSRRWRRTGREDQGTLSAVEVVADPSGAGRGRLAARLVVVRRQRATDIDLRLHMTTEDMHALSALRRDGLELMGTVVYRNALVTQ